VSQALLRVTLEAVLLPHGAEQALGLWADMDFVEPCRESVENLNQLLDDTIALRSVQRLRPLRFMSAG
jgi:hypothetical protein